MMNKLAILTTAFVLALSAAAFASPISDLDPGEQNGGSEVAADRTDLVGSDQEEQQFVLYIAPAQQEVIPQPDADDHRVN